MDYAAKHSKALRKVEEYGAPVSFNFETPGAYDPLTDTEPPPVPGSIAGQAVEIPSDPIEFEAMGLVGTQALTLFFVPDDFDADLPPLHSTVVWAGALRTIDRVFPIRPSGELIAARVIVE